MLFNKMGLVGHFDNLVEEERALILGGRGLKFCLSFYTPRKSFSFAQKIMADSILPSIDACLKSFNNVIKEIKQLQEAKVGGECRK